MSLSASSPISANRTTSSFEHQVEVGQLVDQINRLRETNLTEAIAFYEASRRRVNNNIYLLNAGIPCYGDQDPQKAVALFQEIVTTQRGGNFQTYHFAMKACLKGDLFERGMEIFNSLGSHNFLPILVTYNMALDLCVKPRWVDKAQTLFQHLQNDGFIPDRYTYTAMIRVLGNGGREQEALGLYEEMLSKEIKPDTLLLNALIRACGKGGLTDKAAHYFDEIDRVGLQKNLPSFNDLIFAYAENGEIDKAVAVLRSITTHRFNPNAYSYNPIILAYLAARLPLKAFELLIEMEQKKLFPRVDTCHNLIEAFLRDKNLNRALKVYHKMRANKKFPTPLTYNIFIEAFGNRGEVPRTLEIFNQMKQDGVKPNVITFTSLMDVLVKANQPKKALELFREMEEAEVEPNEVTDTILLQVYTLLGEQDKALKIVNKPRSREVLDHPIYVTASLTPFLAQENLSGALEFLAGNIPEPYPKTAYTVVIDLAVKLGEMERGRALFSQYKAFYPLDECFIKGSETPTLDCHGITAGFAILIIEQWLEAHQELEVITGIGSHSKHPLYNMKGRIRDYFDKNPSICLMQQANPGRVILFRMPPQEAPKVANLEELMEKENLPQKVGKSKKTRAAKTLAKVTKENLKRKEQETKDKGLFFTFFSFFHWMENLFRSFFFD